jgi:hypothetical protein
MKKYIPSIVEALTGPKPAFNTNILSPTRVLGKRKILAECKKIWKYRREEELHQEIAFTYLSLVRALK